MATEKNKKTAKTAAETEAKESTVKTKKTPAPAPDETPAKKPAKKKTVKTPPTEDLPVEEIVLPEEADQDPAAIEKANEQKLNALVEKGKAAGKLSSKEIMDVLDNLTLSPDELDKFYDKLENLGIETVREYCIPDLADIEEPPVEEMEEIPEDEIVDPNSLVDTFGTEDPVRMYLKEIGKVNLLTS